MNLCKELIYFLIIINYWDFITAEITDDSTNKCAAFGEYCQNHFDCCSNSCLTFSYKCINSRRNPQPVATSAPPMLISSIEELINRFGGVGVGDDDNNRNNMGVGGGVINPTTNSATSNLATALNNIPMSDGSTSHDNPNCLGVGLSCLFSNQCCTMKCSSLDKRCTNNLQNDQQSEPNCAPLGTRCYQSSECCSNRCLEYLHKCVT